jgi:hypothetical protein
MPIWQVRPPVQVVPQPPQFELSVVVFTHALPQWVRPALHWQTLFTHAELAGQTLPHMPQLPGSDCVLTQAPPQLTWPAGHWQLLLMHESPAPQTLPHAPQLAGSTRVSAHLLPHS